MIGTLFLGAVLFFALAAVFCETQGKTTEGRICAALAGLASLGAAAFLFVIILNDDFSYTYVISYSSISLPLLYKLSAFWAGQQGSFLLWLVIHAIVGVLIAREGRMTATGRTIYHALTAMLVLLVLFKSPFAPAETVAMDGHGMNPLLQDPWMAVHPPIIFVGYALLAVPFVYSLESMIKAPMDGGVLVPMRRWTLIAWAFLGAGIFIGGYWAYKVLGWGGYWGWDPVENSSLVPWLAAGVLVHLLSAARVRPTNLALTHLSAIFSYALALYGTFLARSGLLGDFSVHSFSGTGVGLWLVAVDAIAVLAGLSLLVWRAGKFPKGSPYPAHRSREFFLLLGCLALTFLAIIVFIGMSMPLLTGLGGDSAAVDTGFYTKTSLPLAICMLLAMAVGSLLRYGEGQASLPKALIGAVFMGAAAAGLAGVREVSSLVLAGAAAAAVFASVLAWRGGALRPAAAIAHAGAALALFTMALTSAGTSTTLEFVPDEPQSFGRNSILYEGMELSESRREKEYVFRVDGEEVRALTKLSASGEDAAREPAIAHGAAGDIYIAPSPVAVGHEIVLQRGKAILEGDLAYRLEHVTEEPDPEDQDRRIFLAAIAVTDGETVDLAEVSLTAAGMKAATESFAVLNGKRRLRLLGISEDRKSIMLQILPALEEEARLPLTASVSEKPLLWLLWLGAAFVFVGTSCAVRRRC